MTADCLVDTPPRNYRDARNALRAHAEHGPGCLRHLVAGAFLSAGLEDED